MAIRIDKNAATAVLSVEARIATIANSSPEWIERVQRISRMCEDGAPKTHIAALGGLLLARCMSREIDLFAIKPTHELNKNNPFAFSLRPLTHDVLVPAATEYGFALGVTGREPLNNQPYFRLGRIGDDTPLHPKARQVFNYLIECIDSLSMTDLSEAHAALRAFIVVRREYQPQYNAHTPTDLDRHKLLSTITEFTLNNSEGGKAAQAVAAGILDVFSDANLVESGRINDPSRKHPGDVCIYAGSDENRILIKAIEVKDKPATFSDIRLFGNKCLTFGIREAAYLMVDQSQQEIPQSAVDEWAESKGLRITLFNGWENFLNQSLFWGEAPTHEAVDFITERIQARLSEIQISSQAMEHWCELIAK